LDAACAGSEDATVTRWGGPVVDSGERRAGIKRRRESPDETGSRPLGRRRRPITADARLLVALSAVVGFAVTLLFTVAQELEPEWQNRSLHVFKETAAALVLLLIAALLFGRFRRSGRLLDLLALAAVILLAGKTLAFSVLTAILAETSGGSTTWRTTGAGMLGSVLLAAAAFSPERTLVDRRRALSLIIGGCLAALGMLLVIASIFELPAAFTDPPETGADLTPLSQDPPLLVADLISTVLFLLAGTGFAIRAEREGDEFQLWLGIGATILGFAYLNYVLFPSTFTDFLYAGDIFRIAAVVVWGIGTVRVISAYQTAYAEAAVLEERRRVARDLHDGVAQELAFIASQLHWLKRRGPDDEDSSEQIVESVQRALDESRGAISALNRPVDEPLDVALAATAEEITGRLGARLDLDLDHWVTVPPAWQEALPRILREAVSNAVRHGGARTVTVHLRDADDVWLRVTDDGKGFDPQNPPEGGYGLISMKERAEALGGEFRLTSQPGQGTSIEVVLP
jgi:signal transduction histidine kinase